MPNVLDIPTHHGKKSSIGLLNIFYQLADIIDFPELKIGRRLEIFSYPLFILYARQFNSVTMLEEKFRDYASKDFGTTLQQAGND